MSLNFLQRWRRKPETSKTNKSLESRRSQYSLVSNDDVSPEVVQVWVKLPDDVRNDPALAPIRRLYCQDQDKNECTDAANDIQTHSNNHCELNNAVNGDAIDATIELLSFGSGKSNFKINPEHSCSEVEISNHVKKKETLWHRGARYFKILFLIACWMFYTSILMLYSEKQLVERHTSLGVGEIKSFDVTGKEDSLRLWVRLKGPFWSEPLEKKYKTNASADDENVMRVWLERREMSSGNSSLGYRNSKAERSANWIIYLFSNSYIDLKEGEPRHKVLEIQHNPEAKQKNQKYKYKIKMAHSINKTVPFTLSYTTNPLDTKTGIVYAAILLIVLYVIIIFDLINRTLAAIITSTTALAVLALVGERPTMSDIMNWMDSETLLLLFSMMVLVSLLSETGVFDYLAVLAFEITKGETWPLINVLFALTMVVSLLLDNVTTVLLLTPATIRLCEVTNLNPVPILMGMVIFCNVGGTATPVGDPPNIIIATNPIVMNAGINFTYFTVHMTPGVLLVFLQTYFQFRFMYRDVNRLWLSDKPEVQKLRQQVRSWQAACSILTENSTEEKILKNAIEKKIVLLKNQIAEESKDNKMRLPKESFERTLKLLKQKYYIKDTTLLIQTIVAMIFIVIVFFLHSLPEINNISLGWTALLGTSLLLVLADRDDLQPVLSKIEWSTLLFFAALFIFMEAITKLGLIQWIGSLTEEIILQVRQEAQLPVAILLVLWISGLTSAFVDNIPLTSMMVRVVTSLGSNPNLDLPMAPLIWALSFGACMGGNGTLVGASANVITAGLAQQHNYRITFKEFFKIGAPMTLGHLITGSLYLIVCHCLFTWH